MNFDGPNKLITLSAATLELASLWTAYKAWLLAGNAGYALAMDTLGGDPIDPTAGTLVPLYLFLLNGWKIRPMESDHTLYVTNGTLVVSGGGGQARTCSTRQGRRRQQGQSNHPVWQHGMGGT